MLLKWKKETSGPSLPLELFWAKIYSCYHRDPNYQNFIFLLLNHLSIEVHGYKMSPGTRRGSSLGQGHPQKVPDLVHIPAHRKQERQGARTHSFRSLPRGYTHHFCFLPTCHIQLQSRAGKCSLYSGQSHSLLKFGGSSTADEEDNAIGKL